MELDSTRMRQSLLKRCRTELTLGGAFASFQPSSSNTDNSGVFQLVPHSSCVYQLVFVSVAVPPPCSHGDLRSE